MSKNILKNFLKPIDTTQELGYIIYMSERKAHHTNKKETKMTDLNLDLDFDMEPVDMDEMDWTDEIDNAPVELDLSGLEEFPDWLED